MKVKKEYKFRMGLKLFGLSAGLITILPAFVIPDTSNLLESCVLGLIVIIFSGYITLPFRIKLILLKDGFVNVGHLKTIYMGVDDVASCVVTPNKITLTSKNGERFSIDKRWKDFNELKEDGLIKQLSKRE